MADQYSKTDKLSATAAQSAMVGMVISGRAARACDVCGKERARWYCAADMAYLCERCDGAVHSANAVAGRHERVRLGPNGTPLKMKSTPAVYVKREASANTVAAHPSAQFNPRKRPRSIRRHKPSSLHAASKHVIGLSIHASNHNHVSSHASSYNSAGSILATTHGVMIDNPRSNPDFIANIISNELFNKSINVKAEPYSPVDVGDQVKVPDHLDDDHLLESLFDFRDLQDDHLFLHQVPIYNPLHNQDLSPTLDSAKEEEEHKEKKPIINIITSRNDCANAHSPQLSQAAEDSKGTPFEQRIEDNDAPSLANCDDEDQSMDPNSDICDLDQLDFDCVLQGNDEDSDDMNHTSINMDINSHDYVDVYPCDATEDSGFAEVSYDHHDNCNMDDADGQYESEQHPGYVAEFDLEAMGSDSPRTWLCKVKVETPPELGSLPGQHGDLYDDALLREKLTCKGFSSDSPACFKLGLKLNFEDVVRSWSDRGTFWTDGNRPSQVGNCLDFLGGYFVPEMSVPRTEGEGPQMVPALKYKNKQSDGSAREASVLRYREKRRTRLFSKKIRYEVRKLNAEKRPRMKGRFIKRMAI